MNMYPTRAKFTRDAYLNLVVGGEAWVLMKDIISGKRVVLFLPGSIKFGFVGFLGVVPISSIIISLIFTVFKNSEPAIVGKFMMSAGILLTFIHAFMMMLVGLGLIYAQQDLMRYLTVLMIVNLLCLLLGVLYSAPLGVMTYVTFGWVVSLMLLYYAKSTSFTLYADLMRIKRICYQGEHK
jgi:hypothetical protein